MKRIIYSAGFFLAALFLSAGFLLSYQIKELKDRMYRLEESHAQAQQTVSSLTDAKGQDFVFERYEDGRLQKEYYRITAYGKERVVLRQELLPAERKTADKDTSFQLRLEDGYIVVYRNDTKEVFEYTDIPLEVLPQELQSEVLLGKTLEDADDLYDFLENYSS